MTDEEMRLELELLDVKDNPFDVMLHHSMELTRDLLFACHRLKNPDVMKQFWPSDAELKSRMRKINNEFSKLLEMSDEATAMCRETSYYYPPDRFEKLNQDLLDFERNMDTVWSRCSPARNDRFEQIRLGKDSEEYKRLVELREIISKSEDLSKADDNYLNSLCDVISRPDECIRYWMSQEEFEAKQKIVKKYKLLEDDVDYMISYRRKLPGGFKD